MEGSLPVSAEERSPLLIRTKGQPFVLIYLGNKKKLKIGGKIVSRLNA
jgi:hypothetical protein